MSSFLPANLHPIDRIARVLIGLGLLSLVMVPEVSWGLLAAVVGMVLIATAGAGSCPIYTLTGLSSAAKDEG